MLHTPIYDPEKTFEENYHEGPFGEYADSEAYMNEGEPQTDFLGVKVYLPFGIPAGPLPTSNHVAAVFRKGYDIAVYKTVRSQAYECHPKPNIVPLQITGDLTLEKADRGVTASTKYTEPLAITNSFGVPSFSPDVWQPDLEAATQAAGHGQVVVGSFQGTNRGEGEDAFIKDHAIAAKLVKETGVPVMEMNASCPNEGSTNLLCFDTDRMEKILTAVKNEIGDTPLIVKLAYFKDQNHLADYVKRLGKLVDGFATINTISAEIRDASGKQALPGEGRLRSGICGAPIKWAGLEMVARLKKLREENNMKFAVIGVGGVTKPEDYFEYMNAGADAVMSATGAMWNPFLAQEIKSQVK
ncbi:tRNA-dihydrouridine synthase [Candidatus Microgenomates bacterium]|nr:tRNA-dihydrouridine synthase [Candidatus Microgenomates bacterium]